MMQARRIAWLIPFVLIVFGNRSSAEEDAWLAMGVRENRLPSVVARYYDNESISLSWETDPKIIRELLPPPLEPTDSNRVSCSISRNGKVVSSRPYAGVESYMIGTISISCQYRGIRGRVALSMIEDDDFPVFAGREMLGYPKKLGKLFLKREGRRIHAYIERRGVRLLELRAVLVDDLPPLPSESERYAPLTGEITESSKYRWSGFRFKFLRRHDDRGFDYGPFLVRQPQMGGAGFSRRGVTQQAKVVHFATATSPYDSPYGKLQVAAPPTIATYASGGASTMLSGEVVEEIDVDPKLFEPFSYYFYDY